MVFKLSLSITDVDVFPKSFVRSLTFCGKDTNEGQNYFAVFLLSTTIILNTCTVSNTNMSFIKII